MIYFTLILVRTVISDRSKSVDRARARTAYECVFNVVLLCACIQLSCMRCSDGLSIWLLKNIKITKHSENRHIACYSSRETVSNYPAERTKFLRSAHRYEKPTKGRQPKRAVATEA